MEAQLLPQTSAWWSGSFSDLVQTDPQVVINELSFRASQAGLAPRVEQLDAWTVIVPLLREVARSLLSDDRNWGVAIEFVIPRRALRPDAVILAGDVIVPIEFKVGASTYERAARMQVSEYALDLRDFHEASHLRAVVPVLAVTDAAKRDIDLSGDEPSARVQCSPTANLRETLCEVVARWSTRAEPLDVASWTRSRYRPTPGILETARDVLRGNQVRAISASYANNLGLTVDAVRAIVDASEAEGVRAVCFVTGVPGSGKTLAGLSVVHEPGEGRGARAYMSGNGPLIDVLRFAVARDLYVRNKATMEDARRKARTLIQPVHRFVQELGKSSHEPAEHVVVFDEAQRAWDQRRMEQKQGIPASEAAVTLDIMERKSTWAVVVALIGGGQEINSGEAGIEAWCKALVGRPQWRVHAAPEIADVEPALRARTTVNHALHLDSSVRSPRAVAIAAWADAVTSGQLESARTLSREFEEFPLLLTRSLSDMRTYLRDRARPDRRTGLIASSQARRLRPFGIEMDGAFQGDVNWPQWFVNDQNDVRSSYALEVAASEFKCQGLEIDWAGLCWGCDFTWQPGSWRARRLKGDRWQNDQATDFARNRYRVLLTRARHGLVIWVPEPGAPIPLVDGDALNRTAQALLTAGARPLACSD